MLVQTGSAHLLGARTDMLVIIFLIGWQSWLPLCQRTSRNCTWLSKAFIKNYTARVEVRTKVKHTWVHAVKYKIDLRSKAAMSSFATYLHHGFSFVALILGSRRMLVKSQKNYFYQLQIHMTWTVLKYFDSLIMVCYFLIAAFYKYCISYFSFLILIESLVLFWILQLNIQWMDNMASRNLSVDVTGTSGTAFVTVSSLHCCLL